MLQFQNACKNLDQELKGTGSLKRFSLNIELRKDAREKNFIFLSFNVFVHPMSQLESLNKNLFQFAMSVIITCISNVKKIITSKQMSLGGILKECTN